MSLERRVIEGNLEKKMTSGLLNAIGKGQDKWIIESNQRRGRDICYWMKAKK